MERDHGDSKARELWPKLKSSIPALFEAIDIKPSLLHGDLWSGNVAKVDGKPG